MGKHYHGTEGQTLLKEFISNYPKTAKSVEIFNDLPSAVWNVLESEGRGKGKTKQWSVYRQICKMR
jgi:hypothetical protein